MTTQVVPSSKHSITKIVSLGRILRLQSVSDYMKITQGQDQEGNGTQAWIDSSPQSTGSPASEDHTKRRMSFQRLRNSKRPGTVLRAVPETTACEPALHADERDMSTSTHQAKSCKSASSSPALSLISENEAAQEWAQHNTTPPAKHDSTLKTA